MLLLWVVLLDACFWQFCAHYVRLSRCGGGWLLSLVTIFLSFCDKTSRIKFKLHPKYLHLHSLSFMIKIVRKKLHMKFQLIFMVIFIAFNYSVCLFAFFFSFSFYFYPHTHNSSSSSISSRRFTLRDGKIATIKQENI
jgi:hypothetical protein